MLAEQEVHEAEGTENGGSKQPSRVLQLSAGEPERAHSERQRTVNDAADDGVGGRIHEKRDDDCSEERPTRAGGRSRAPPQIGKPGDHSQADEVER